MEFKNLLSFALLTATLGANAQSNFCVAITGDAGRDYQWMNVQKLNLEKGTIGESIFQKKANFTLTNVLDKSSVNNSAIDANRIYFDRNFPTATMVAGAAYDRKSGKVFFMPMRLSELRWIDLDKRGNAPAFYTLPSSTIVAAGQDEANHVTRMVIAADGFGYAITNDGNHVYRFTTGKNPAITDLGALKDATENKLTIHNKCSSWGGDMIADINGKLQIITAQKHIFEVDPSTLVATFKGTITGIPAGVTTNAAAVDAEDNIIVAGATGFTGIYKVNAETLEAVLIPGSATEYSISDFANGNLLGQYKAAMANNFVKPLPIDAATETNVYPNPVTGSSFKLNLNGYAVGTYNVIVSDLNGKVLQAKKVNITKFNQSEQISFGRKPVSGMYFVKVIDGKNQVIMNDKIVVQ